MSTGSFWIIGCGNMAGAMLARWIEAGTDLGTVQVVDPAMPALPGGLTCLPAIRGDAGKAGRILIAIKPQMLEDAAPAIAQLVGPDTVILSILAGVEVDALKAHFPEARRIVRVMPNLPVALGKGVVALYAPDGPDGETDALMAPLGLVEWFEDEDQLHLVASLAASGPAFLYRFIDALGIAATRLGMDAGQAGRLALAMVDGASSLAVRAADPPAVLAEKVASKGGMTRKGLDILDDGEELIGLLERTLEAARDRSVELGEAAKRA